MPIVSTQRKGEQCVTITLPELLQLSKNARQLTLSTARPASSQSGQHMSRLLGRGMEFVESRRYQAGDDIRAIDWRVTARTGKAHTKLFAAEKERQVLLCVDMRSPMFFATQGVFKSIQAALLSGYVAWNAVQTGNRLGGIIFDDTDLIESRPAQGKRGILPFLQNLAEQTHFSSEIKHPPAPSLSLVMDNALASIQRIATPGSLVFIISDFRHFSSFAYTIVNQLSKHSDLCLCFIYDPLEAALPTGGYYPITDGAAVQQLNTHDKKLVGKYRQQFIERKEKIATLARQRRIRFMECSTVSDCLELLTQHFRGLF